MSSLIIADEMDGSMYFVGALDLDYEEPNSVVDDMDLEFIVAEEFVQTVELAVETPVVEKVVVVRERQREAA